MFGALLEERVIRDPYWNMWGAGADITPTGDVRVVGSEQAIRLMAVYACVKFVSDSISMLPLDIFRNKGRNRVKIDPAPRWIDMPNPEQSRQEFLGQMLWSLLLDGNAYALIVRDRFGQVAELWPLHPDQVVPNRKGIGSPITYDIHQIGSPVTSATAANMFHVRGTAGPGDIKGRNPIQDARLAISTGLSLQDYAHALFDNGVTPSAVIETPANAQVNAKELREEAQKMHQGAKKAQGLMVLTGGATFKPISVNPNDAQFLESQNFTGAAIAAGMFGLHPEMIGLTHGIAGGKDITYQNLESRWVEIARRALQPSMTKFEFAYSTLLPGFAQNGQYSRFDIGEYLRADAKTQAEVAQIALGGATGQGKRWKTQDEVRDDFDLPPLPAAELNDPPAPVTPPPDEPPAPAPDQGNK